MLTTLPSFARPSTGDFTLAHQHIHELALTDRVLDLRDSMLARLTRIQHHLRLSDDLRRSLDVARAGEGDRS